MCIRDRDIPAPAIAPPAVNTAASIFLVFLFLYILYQLLLTTTIIFYKLQENPGVI